MSSLKMNFELRRSGNENFNLQPGKMMSIESVPYNIYNVRREEKRGGIGAKARLGHGNYIY